MAVEVGGAPTGAWAVPAASLGHPSATGLCPTERWTSEPAPERCGVPRHRGVSLALPQGVSLPPPTPGGG